MRNPSFRSLCVLAVAAGVMCFAAQSSDAGNKRKSSKRPLTKTKFDPTAKRVQMFDAIDEGQIEVKVIAKNALGGKLLFENKTSEALTVELPDAFVGVQVLNQGLGGGGLGGGGLGGGGLGGGQGGGFGQGGGGQGFGGGAGQGGGGLGGGGLGGGGLGGGGLGGGGGGGFFSIPPERVVSVPYNSVCLEHGKKDPNPRMTYKLVPVEKFTADSRVKELCKLVAQGRIDAGAAQAAAWNLANKMSWQQLAAKQHIRSTSRTPYFSRAQLMLAQRIVSEATGRAREAAKKKDRGEAEEKQQRRFR